MLCAVAAVATMVLSACSQPVDPGNLSVFCDLLNDGIGLDEGDGNPNDYVRLGKVAPPELRDTIEALRVAALEFDELDKNDLAGRFAVRFNSEALGAQQELQNYAIATCGTGTEPSAGKQNMALRAEIDEYLTVTAAGRPWVDQIELFPATLEGIDRVTRVDSVRVVFVEPPEDSASFAEICSVVSGWLYGQKQASGNVTVDHDGVILAQRIGSDGQCTVS